MTSTRKRKVRNSEPRDRIRASVWLATHNSADYSIHAMICGFRHRRCATCGAKQPVNPDPAVPVTRYTELRAEVDSGREAQSQGGTSAVRSARAVTARISAGPNTLRNTWIIPKFPCSTALSPEKPATCQLSMFVVNRRPKESFPA